MLINSFLLLKPLVVININDHQFVAFSSLSNASFLLQANVRVP